MRIGKMIVHFARLISPRFGPRLWINDGPAMFCFYWGWHGIVIFKNRPELAIDRKEPDWVTADLSDDAPFR